MLDEHKFSKWHKSNKVFIGFLLRFVAAFLLLTLLYELYLYYTNKVGSLDLITYFISRGSFETAKALGVVDCQWSCFYDGCYVGREGKMVNIIEGCNGLRLAIVYSAYVIGIGGINFESLLQMIVGFIMVQFFNIFRIGLLIALRDNGGDYYFFFLKYFFTVSIYLSVVVLWLLKPKIDRKINNLLNKQ